jgi:iron complex outermembrane recepter protein
MRMSGLLQRARMNRLRGTSAVSVLIACLTVTPTLAQSERSNFDIPQTNLAAALIAYSKQAGINVALDNEQLGQRAAPAVRGNLTHEEALRQLLAGTGLRYEFVTPATVRLISPAPHATSERPSSVPVQLAPRRKVDPSEPPPEEVVVVGSRLQPNARSALPTTVIDNAAIQASGAQTINNVLNDLPQASFRSTTSAAQSGRGSSTINLRGLPNGTTLVLVNGRPLAPSAFSANNGTLALGTIGLAAVERIEILSSGSSAVYGGNALAGVVNIVLKRHIDGAVFDARYGFANGYDETSYSLGMGGRIGRGSLSLVAQYDANSELGSDERTITRNPSLFGGTQRIWTGIAYPPNVSTIDGRNLPGLNSPRATVPPNSTGIGLTPADFAATAGKVNSGNAMMVPQRPVTQQYGVSAFGDYELTDEITAYGEFLYSHRLAKERDYLYSTDTSLPVGTPLIVPADNPKNPFGVPVKVDYLFAGAGRFCYCVTQEYYRGVGGARGSLGSWKWDAGILWTHGRADSNDGMLRNDKLVAALADQNPATGFNPFQVRSWTWDEVQRFTDDTVQTSTTTSTVFQGNIKGDLFQLPTGPVRLLLGGEFELQKLDYTYYLVHAAGDRTVASGLGELRVPIWGAAEEGGPERIALQGALRYDSYSDFGRRLSEQVGLEVRPVRGVLLRGSYNSAFKPPTLYQLWTPQTNPSANLMIDPARGGENYMTMVINGGNPNLAPMTGRSNSYGVLLRPDSVPGLEVSVDRWRTRIDNYARTMPPEVILANESLFPQYIVRAAPTATDIAAGRPGRVTEIKYITLNFGVYDIAGIDIAARWRIGTPYGEFVPSAAFTRTTRYRTALLPGVPADNRLGVASTTGYAPSWKGNVALAWSTRMVSASFTGHYVSSYRDYAPSKIQLGDFWMFDAQARVDLSEWMPNSFLGAHQAHLTVGGRNLFDKLPVYSTNGGGAFGYDPSQYDIVGRFLYVSLGVKF